MSNGRFFIDYVVLFSPLATISFNNGTFLNYFTTAKKCDKEGAKVSL